MKVPCYVCKGKKFIYIGPEDMVDRADEHIPKCVVAFWQPCERCKCTGELEQED